MEPFFASFWKKFTVSKNFCLKFNRFMLQSQKNELLSVIEVAPFRPSIIPVSICKEGVVLVRIVRRNSSFYRLETKQQGPRRVRDWAGGRGGGNK